MTLRKGFVLWLAFTLLATWSPAAEPTPFIQRLQEANRLLNEGKLEESLASVKAAALLDTNRFEAPFLAAAILLELRKPESARLALDAAYRLAPPDKKAKLEPLRVQLDALKKAEPSQQSTSVSDTVSNVPPAKLTTSARLQLDVLMLIIEEADKAKLDTDRKKLLQEFLEKSEPFVKENPDQLSVWTLRAVAALELSKRKNGWEAGKQLKRLGADKSDDPKLLRVLALLDRRGLMAKDFPSFAPNGHSRWTNSLGMVFMPVPQTDVLFCIWETRVKDFAAFVAETGYDATPGMKSMGSDGSKVRGDSWKSPGFDQTMNHPVCGVSWNDASAFCDWLTRKERDEGLADMQQSYRLPTSAERLTASGVDKYPWGQEWPPPVGAGNYSGAESDLTGKIENYADGFNRTAPVGSFNPNQHGLYDMGGNLWEWGADNWQMDSNERRSTFGAAWNQFEANALSSRVSYNEFIGVRNSVIGFRCVLAQPRIQVGFMPGSGAQVRLRLRNDSEISGLVLNRLGSVLEIRTLEGIRMLVSVADVVSWLTGP